ncbi:MAG TPA: TonB family protein [Terriglobales bacterium]|nr:TonB family protein [Terriglobales bacterium]
MFYSPFKRVPVRSCACKVILQRALVLCLALLASGAISSLCAEKGDKPEKNDKPTRRLVYKVEPEYPWDLKRASIGGLVRLDIVISARGTVETVTPIGGNPVLLESAARAVKKWRYAPSDAETEILINIEFDPRR